jgi:signal recognition particle subunit SEC65
MDPANFLCIYPSYLDATKPIAQGRRIGAEKAVDTPTVSDISQALQSLNIRHVLQPHKGYSRDVTCSWDNPGRVQYEKPTMYTKRQLLVEVAALIPALPSRKQRLAQQANRLALEEQKAKEEAAERERSSQGQKQLQLQQQQQTSSKSSSKKKGKKKR